MRKAAVLLCQAGFSDLHDCSEAFLQKSLVCFNIVSLHYYTSLQLICFSIIKQTKETLR